MTLRAWLLAALLALLVPGFAAAQDPSTSGSAQQTQTGTETTPTSPAPSAPSGQSGADAYSEDVPIPARPSGPQGGGGGSQQGGGGSGAQGSGGGSQQDDSSPQSSTTTTSQATPSARRRPAPRQAVSTAARGDRPVATERPSPVAAQPAASPESGSDSLLGLGLALTLLTALLVGAAGYRRGHARA
jgi:hypothetical protein